MAKQIVLAHPFERLSGQVTREKQALVYNNNRNPIWDAPVGKQAALNFKPQMVVSYNSKTGKQSFRIQTHSTTDNTEPARLRMALFGATIACVTAATHNPVLLSALYDAYKTVEDEYKSFKSWLSIWMRLGLKNKSATITIGQGVNIKNPWVGGGTGTELTISDEILIKFAPYLCNGIIVVDGVTLGAVPIGGLEEHLWEELANRSSLFYKQKQFEGFGTRETEHSPEEEFEEIMTYKGNDLYKGSSLLRAYDSLDAGVNAATTTAPNA